ncbi:MAG: glyoxalase, partial [Flavisolibacter sp.]
MKHQVKSIRPFIGARDYNNSRQFYLDLGFTEHEISPAMSYFEAGGFGFYLQDYYAKDWIDNTMVFLEVDDVD